MGFKVLVPFKHKFWIKHTIYKFVSLKFPVVKLLRSQEGLILTELAAVVFQVEFELW